MVQILSIVKEGIYIVRAGELQFIQYKYKYTGCCVIVVR